MSTGDQELYSYHAAIAQGQLRAALREFPWCAKRFRRALADADDSDAGFSLVVAAPNHVRGLIAVWLYYRLRAGDCGVDIYRTALDGVWNHDHDVLIATVRDRRVLRSMFRWAGFPVPSEMPAMIDIWRGVHGKRSVRRASCGISWTIDRDMACWFAMRFASPKRKPMVLKATMPRDSLFYPYNDRNEFEVVCFDAVDVAIDGDPEDWAVGAERVRQAHTASLDDLRASLAQAAEG